MQKFKQIGPNSWTVTEEWKQTEEYKTIMTSGDAIVWCKCGPEAHADYVDDGQCSCKIYKHHYHCVECGNVQQIG
jgi:hypothetical protein